MSKNKDKDIERLKTILEKIEDIEKISKKSITKALNDKTLSRPAILMHFIAIAEQFDKLKKNSSKLLEEFDKNDLQGSYNIRNFIAHDYEGVNLSIIELTISERLTIIKIVIKNILKKDI